MKRLLKTTASGLYPNRLKSNFLFVLTFVLIILAVSPVTAQAGGTGAAGETSVPLWVQAGLWGLFAGAASLLGAAIGYLIKIPQRVLAGIMAFGSGVLISAMSFELIETAYNQGGLMSTAIGFFGGALLYSGINRLLARLGAKRRKRSSGQPSEQEDEGSGIAIAIGATLDDIPESMAIGLTMLAGGTVSMAMVIAIFISNIPEGLSSSAGMRQAGRSALYVFSIWIVIAVVTGLSALIGYSMFIGLSDGVQAATTAVAAGAILSMISETMIPEAFEGTHNWAGLITCSGFLCAFTISVLGG